jgi:hypothetical protein
MVVFKTTPEQTSKEEINKLLTKNVVVMINGFDYVKGDLGCGFVIMPPSMMDRLKKAEIQNINPCWIVRTF